MAASQRGIPRPRKTKADLPLREAILEILTELQGTRTLSALADDLGISAKTLSRYRNASDGKAAMLGGDLLFRICALCDERDISIACHGRILRLRRGSLIRLSGAPAEQLRFTFAGTIDIDVPTRKGVMRVDSIAMDDHTKTG
jgi:transcriptional regulator with XRE-family HTH domain